MTIYNFNQGIGWASSGVEYAQAYRSNIFEKNKQDAKFIFTDLFVENLQTMTSNIGFTDKDIIWLYGFFTDIKISPTTFTLDDLEKTFFQAPDRVKRSENTVIYFFDTINLRLTASLDKFNKQAVYRTEFVIAEKLLRRDYYSYTKIFSEYFKPVDNQANIYQRRFFNEDGSAAYDELINSKESLYIFEDLTIYSKESLIEHFVESLNLNSHDIVLIDRSTGMGPQILKASREAKVGVVIHAEHFNAELTTSEQILWNNFYDYQLENAETIDFFITATERQQEILEQQFRKYKKGKIKIYTIPVGSIDKLKKSKKRKKNSLITASRLASEKHLDWQIRAVHMAQKTIKDLTLDIYGQGGEYASLKKLIAELHAESFIKLKGQQNLNDVYKEYQTYVSTSTSEGFGLTLLEAVGSGLGMIGYDVHYGNQTFIVSSKNGYLIDYTKNSNEDNISKVSKAIVEMCSKSDQEMESIFNSSYKIAERYLTKKVKELWINLEKEVLNND